MRRRFERYRRTTTEEVIVRRRPRRLPQHEEDWKERDAMEDLFWLRHMDPDEIERRYNGLV